MTPIRHDPYRSHVHGYPAQVAQETSEPPRGADCLDRVTATLADGMTVDDLTGWCVDHPGGMPHVLATLDALAAV